MNKPPQPSRLLFFALAQLLETHAIQKGPEVVENQRDCAASAHLGRRARSSSVPEHQPEAREIQNRLGDLVTYDRLGSPRFLLQKKVRIELFIMASAKARRHNLHNTEGNQMQNVINSHSPENVTITQVTQYSASNIQK